MHFLIYNVITLSIPTAWANNIDPDQTPRSAAFDQGQTVSTHPAGFNYVNI